MFFNVWHPFVPDPTHASFDVTPRQIAVVNKGTSSFVSSCLESCGLAAPTVSSWAVTCVRQAYYSDYSESQDWRSRWDLAWAFDVVLETPVVARNLLEPFPFVTEARDPTSGDEEEPALRAGPALVIAWFDEQAQLQQRVEAVASEWSARNGIGGRIAIRFNRYDGGVTQVRVLPEHVAFPDQIESLDLLNGELGAAGGITNWRGLPTKR